MDRDWIVTVNSGTEITVEAALGDIEKIVASMGGDKSNDWSGEMSDLESVAAFLVYLAERVPNELAQ